MALINNLGNVTSLQESVPVTSLCICVYLHELYSLLFMCSDSFINRNAFTGIAGPCHTCHSPSIGGAVMATPTKVAGQ